MPRVRVDHAAADHQIATDTAPDGLEPLETVFLPIYSRNGDSWRYRKTTNFGHYVKRDKEVEEERAYFRFSTYRCRLGFAADFEIITVRGVEDLKILFEAFGDFGPDDGCV